VPGSEVRIATTVRASGREDDDVSRADTRSRTRLRAHLSDGGGDEDGRLVATFILGAAIHTRVLPGVRWHAFRTFPRGRRSIASILFIRPEGL
jgi:hypothetical protein